MIIHFVSVENSCVHDAQGLIIKIWLTQLI
jgi:hypothetical protein